MTAAGLWPGFSPLELLHLLSRPLRSWQSCSLLFTVLPPLQRPSLTVLSGAQAPPLPGRLHPTFLGPGSSFKLHIFSALSDGTLQDAVQSLTRVRLFLIPWTAARQASLSIANSLSPPKPMSIDAIQPSHPLSSPSPPAPNPSQHQGLFQ